MTQQVAVLIDFEDLLAGAEESLPGDIDPVPYAAVELLCRSYGNAAVRRAYADWARVRFSRYQVGLVLNGVDLIHVTRFGIQHKNAVDIRLAIDAMELIFTRPDVGIFVVVAGDGDYTPLAQRLRELGKQLVGVGTQASANRRLVSVCSEYRYWATLVAQADPRAATAVAAEFDIDYAERLLVNAVRQSNQPVLAGVLRGRMLAVDPSFDERNYGCKSFRDFLGRMAHAVLVERKAYDLVVALPDGQRTEADAGVAQEQSEPALPALLGELRALGIDFPLRPEVRDDLLASVHSAWRDGRLRRVSDIGDALLNHTDHPQNKNTRVHLCRALVGDDTAPIPLAEQPMAGVRLLRQCTIARYDGSPPAGWTRQAHTAWLAWIMYQLKYHHSLDQEMVSTFFAGSTDYGAELVSAADELLRRRMV